MPVFFMNPPRVLEGTIIKAATQYPNGDGTLYVVTVHGLANPNFSSFHAATVSRYQSQRFFAGTFDSSTKVGPADPNPASLPPAVASAYHLDTDVPPWIASMKYRRYATPDGTRAGTVFYTDNNTAYRVQPLGGSWVNGGEVQTNPPAMLLVADTQTYIWVQASYSAGTGTGTTYKWRVLDPTTSTFGAYTVMSTWATAKDENLQDLRVVKGPGTLWYLTYVRGTLAGTFQGLLRTFDTATNTASAILHTTTLASQALEPRSISGGDRVYTIGTTNYFFQWWPGGTVDVYSYQTGSPSTITKVTSGSGVYPNGTDNCCMSVEWDPTTPQGRLVHWTEYSPPSGYVYLGVASVDFTGPITSPLTSQVTNPSMGNTVSTSTSDLGSMIGVVGNVYGPTGWTRIHHMSVDGGGGIIGGGEPNLMAWQLKTWSDPVIQTADIAIDLSSSMAVNVTTTGTILGVINIAPEFTITLDPKLTKTTIVSARWVIADSAFINVDSNIDLSSSFSVSIVATVQGSKFGEAVIDLYGSMDVQVGLVSEIVYELTQKYVSVRTTWMDEFMKLVNDKRATVGRAPYLTYGSDVLSKKKLALYDPANTHSRNMSAIPYYAHESTLYPIGEQTANQRIAKVSTAGSGAENIYADASFAFYAYNDGGTVYPPGYLFLTPLRAYTAWINSPVHYANIMLDWVSLKAGSFYSDMGIEFGDPDPAFGVNGTQWKYWYVCNNFIALQEVTVELQFGQYWEFNGATIAILDDRWNNFAYANVKASHSLVWALRLTAEHQAPSSFYVAASHESSSYYTVSGSHEASYVGSIPISQGVHEVQYAIRQEISSAQHQTNYGLAVSGFCDTTYGVPVRVAFAQDSGYEAMLKASNSHESGYESSPRALAVFISEYEAAPKVSKSYESEYGTVPRVSVVLESPYEANPRVQASVEAFYDSPSKVQGLFIGPYEAASKVGASLSANYAVLVSVRMQFVAPSVMPTPVSAYVASGYDISLMNKISAICDSRYALATSGNLVGNSAVYMTHKGVQYRLDDAYISSGRGDSGYTFEAKVWNPDLFRNMSELDSLTVDFAGEFYSFIVVGISMARSSPSSVSATISAVSPVYMSDLPYASQVSYVPAGAQLLSVIVSEIMGVPVQWEVPDWVVPVGRAQVTDASRLQGANSLLSSLSASIQSNPDGSLVARYAYPVNWDLVQLIAPAHTFDDGQDVLAVSSSYEYRKGYNKFHLRDSDTSYGDTIQWALDEGSTVSGIAKVTPYPYRNSWTLSTTSTELLTFEDLGEVVETITDFVEFVAGVGSTSRPVATLVSVSWASTSLGGVSFDPYSSKFTVATTINDGYGLAKVTYTTKAFQFKITAGAVIEQAQLIVKEN